MSVAKIQTANFGASVFVVEGPVVLGSGIPASNFTLGSVSWGDSEAEWVYCKLVLASTTVLSSGQWFTWDLNYNATLLTTAARVVGQRVGVWSGASAAPTLGGTITTVSLVAGTYYIWLQRAGQAIALVTAAAVIPNILVAETTTTAGALLVPAAPTVGSGQITPVSFAAANITFTANTVNGSAVLTNLVGANSNTGPFLGAILTGTGVAGLTVAGITYSPSGNIQSLTMSGNASATNAAVTMTVTGVLEVSLMWPYIGKTN